MPYFLLFSVRQTERNRMRPPFERERPKAKAKRPTFQIMYSVNNHFLNVRQLSNFVSVIQRVIHSLCKSHSAKHVRFESFVNKL